MTSLKNTIIKLIKLSLSCQDVALLVKNIKIKIGLLDVEIRLMKLYLIKTFFFF